MKWIRFIAVLIMILWAVEPVMAQDVTPHMVVITVYDSEGNLYFADELGCAWSDDPAPINYGYEPICTNCAWAQCVFTGEMHAWEGVYMQTPNGTIPVEYDPDPFTGTYGVYPHSLAEPQQRFMFWPTNAGAGGNDWEDVYILHFYYDTVWEPTPIPTVTPFPTIGPPPTPDLSEGFSSTFNEAYGAGSAAGVFPGFAADHSQWLFYAKKWIQFINSGNLLYVMGGILMAMLVLQWAIDRIRNPR